MKSGVIVNELADGESMKNAIKYKEDTLKAIRAILNQEQEIMLDEMTHHEAWKNGYLSGVEWVLLNLEGKK